MSMNSKPVTKSPQPLLMLPWRRSDPGPVVVCSPGRHVVVYWENNCSFELRKNDPPFLSHRVIQSKRKVAWRTQFYFRLLEAVICVRLFTVSVKNAYVSLILSEKELNTKCFFSTQLIFRDWVKCLVCFSLTHPGQWFMWNLMAWTHTHL